MPEYAILELVNPLSTNPTKWSNTLKQCVFDHLVKLALKELIMFQILLNMANLYSVSILYTFIKFRTHTHIT